MSAVWGTFCNPVSNFTLRSYAIQSIMPRILIFLKAGRALQEPPSFSGVGTRGTVTPVFTPHVYRLKGHGVASPCGGVTRAERATRSDAAAKCRRKVTPNVAAGRADSLACAHSPERCRKVAPLKSRAASRFSLERGGSTDGTVTEASGG
jgi:hypothetical protein